MEMIDGLGHFRVCLQLIASIMLEVGMKDLGLTLCDLGLGMLTDSCFLIMVQ